jgi:hypothetical protein
MYLHSLDLGKTDLDITEVGKKAYLPILDLARTEVDRTEVGRMDIGRTDIARTELARTELGRTQVWT